MKGRKPKPTAIKLQDGNPGKRPINPDEPKAIPGMPECPAHLDDEATAEWHRMGPQLLKEKRMAPVYKAIFAAYCQAWSRWVHAEKMIQQHGEVIKTPSTGYVVQSPFLQISNKAYDNMVKALTELGLSPSSQSRVTEVKTPATGSRLEEFIAKTKTG